MKLANTVIASSTHLIHNFLSEDPVADNSMQRQYSTNNISEDTLDKASKAKEVIEAYYSNFVRLQRERSERFQKINLLLNQEKLSEDEKLKESFFIIWSQIL